MTSYEHGLSDESKKMLKDAVGVVAGEVFRYAIVIIVTISVLNLAYQFGSNMVGRAIDDSDLNGFHRSGVTIRTDYKTGLQYLESVKGSLTPRLDVDGKQVRVSLDRAANTGPTP